MNEVKKLKKDEAIKIMELPISYEERGIEKGKEIGKEKALQEVVKNMLELGVDLETISK